jgi:lipopolysaccharide/colanic/teichoic acid biosynthesis glycosyltransferase
MSNFIHLQSTPGCNDKMSVKQLFLVLILSALTLVLTLTLLLVVFFNSLTSDCEVSFSQSPLGARHCPSGAVIMD